MLGMYSCILLMCLHLQQWTSTDHTHYFLLNSLPKCSNRLFFLMAVLNFICKMVFFIFMKALLYFHLSKVNLQSQIYFTNLWDPQSPAIKSNFNHFFFFCLIQLQSNCSSIKLIWTQHITHVYCTSVLFFFPLLKVSVHFKTHAVFEGREERNVMGLTVRR